MPYIVWCPACSIGHHEEHEAVVSTLLIGAQLEKNEICICEGECVRKFAERDDTPPGPPTVQSLLDEQRDWLDE